MKTKRILCWVLVWAGALSLFTPLGGNNKVYRWRRIVIFVSPVATIHQPV